MIYRRKYRNAEGDLQKGLSFVDKIISDDGIKADVDVNIPPRVFVYIGVSLIVGIAGAILVAKKLK